MAYDVPSRNVYEFIAQAFGGTTATFKRRGPKGRRGIVRDIRVTPTADMVGTTTVPEVDVGTASGDVSYARFRLGTAAGTGYTAAGGVRNARPLVTGNGATQTFEDFAGHVKLETADVAADTDFVITLKAGTGGSPAGTADVEVHIDWV